MSPRYIETKEVAKFIRAILKETFGKAAKFSVRSDNYSMGSSINITWTGGPSEDQVNDAVKFLSGSYFDGMQDYKGSRFHTLDNAPVRLAADFIFATRSKTDEEIELALMLAAQDHGFTGTNTVAEYRSGSLMNVYAEGDETCTDLQTYVGQYLKNMTTVPFPKESKTAQRFICVGDDGYHSGEYNNHVEAARKGLRIVQ